MAVKQQTGEIIRPDFAFMRAVEKSSGQAVASCFRCLKCTAGCPMAQVMDFPPDRLVRMVQLGLREQVLQSRAIWLCTGCMACSDRCPNGIDVARMIDSLKQMAIKSAGPLGEPRIAAFHQSFLDVVRRFGRLHEATLIAALKLRNRDWTSDVAVGFRMLLKGKIPPIPQRVRGTREVAKLFDVVRPESELSSRGESR